MPRFSLFPLKCYIVLHVYEFFAIALVGKREMYYNVRRYFLPDRAREDKKMKKIVAMLALFAMMMTAAGALAGEACSEHTLIPVGSTAEAIQAKLDAGGKYCLEYISLDTAAFTVPGGKTVELCLHDGMSFRMLEIKENAKLTLKNVGSVNLWGRIVNEGTLNIDFDENVNIDMHDTTGYVLQNENTVTMKNGVIDAPVLNKKSFTMQGGTFCENIVNFVDAEFVMEGGRIRYGGAADGIVENMDGAKFVMKGESAQADFDFKDYDNGTLEVYAGTVYSKDGKLPAYNIKDYADHAYIKVLGKIDDFDSKKLVVKFGEPNFNGNSSQGGGAILPGGNGGESVPSDKEISAMPETGDNSSLALWMLLMALAGVGMWMIRRRAYN